MISVPVFFIVFYACARTIFLRMTSSCSLLFALLPLLLLFDAARSLLVATTCHYRYRLYKEFTQVSTRRSWTNCRRRLVSSPSRKMLTQHSALFSPLAFSYYLVTFHALSTKFLNTPTVLLASFFMQLHTWPLSIQTFLCSLRASPFRICRR